MIGYYFVMMFIFIVTTVEGFTLVLAVRERNLFAFVITAINFTMGSVALYLMLNFDVCARVAC